MSGSSKVLLVAAGGTIGMTYDERAKGYVPSLNAGEMLSWLKSKDLPCEVSVVDWSHQPSSHYNIRMMADLVELLRKEAAQGLSGIVVTTGTDSMEEMAYLVDLLWPYPYPVIFTGSMVPHGELSSDGPLNLYHSLLAASSESTWGLGVLICFQDQLFAANEVCKLNSYRRDAIATFNKGPVAEIVANKICVLKKPKRGRVIEEMVQPAKEVEVLWATLGSGERILKMLAEDENLEGLVLAGFGAGNVNPAWVPQIRQIVRNDVPVVITSRCLQARVLTCYGYEGSAQKLIELGVFSGGNLTPLQARLKLAVGIGKGFTGKDLQSYLLDQ